ncbi:MAG: hypothetical protein M1814_005848 [Vezdaea aestivalis]|nr:MAG: hypothetical protein M1814_005848 [Vezdaea aestivalis]
MAGKKAQRGENDNDSTAATSILSNEATTGRGARMKTTASEGKMRDGLSHPLPESLDNTIDTLWRMLRTNKINVPAMENGMGRDLFEFLNQFFIESSAKYRQMVVEMLEHSGEYVQDTTGLSDAELEAQMPAIFGEQGVVKTGLLKHAADPDLTLTAPAMKRRLASCQKWLDVANKKGIPESKKDAFGTLMDLGLPPPQDLPAMIPRQQYLEDMYTLSHLHGVRLMRFERREPPKEHPGLTQQLQIVMIVTAHIFTMMQSLIDANDRDPRAWKDVWSKSPMMKSLLEKHASRLRDTSTKFVKHEMLTKANGEMYHTKATLETMLSMFPMIERYITKKDESEMEVTDTGADDANTQNESDDDQITFKDDECDEATFGNSAESELGAAELREQQIEKAGRQPHKRKVASVISSSSASRQLQKELGRSTRVKSIYDQEEDISVAATVKDNADTAPCERTPGTMRPASSNDPWTAVDNGHIKRQMESNDNTQTKRFATHQFGTPTIEEN